MAFGSGDLAVLVRVISMDVDDLTEVMILLFAAAGLWLRLPGPAFVGFMACFCAVMAPVTLAGSVVVHLLRRMI